MSYYLIRRAVDADLSQIKKIQDSTHFSTVSEEEKKKEGFISVQTTINQLREINKTCGIIVIEHNSKVIGYELALTTGYARKIPLLVPFVERIMGLTYKKKPLSKYKFIIEGQINIAKERKGKGLVEKLHKAFIEMLNPKYELIVTEISDQNPRSLHVHIKKLGFEEIDSYNAENRNWYVIAQYIR